MKLLRTVFLIFCCVTLGLQALPDQSPMRDLVILLDNNDETNPSRIGAATYDLQNALQAEAAPLLVSASLWHTFIAARQEWTVQAQIPETNEYKATTLMKDINERIAYWFNVLKDDGDDIHVSSLVAGNINAEFYVKERYKQLQKEKRIPKSNNIRYCIITPCFFDAWYWLYLDTGYYLAIPKRYAAQFTCSADVRDVLVATGFSAVLAKYVTDPLDVVYLMASDADLLLPDKTIISTLQDLFQKKDTTAEKYQWSVCIKGHGSNSKLMQGYSQTIVGISLDTFKRVCAFFDEQLSVHYVWVLSCMAGGVNRVALNNGSKTYHYPIVIECIGDVTAVGSLDCFDSFPNGSFLCTSDHFKKIGDTWQLCGDASKRFNKFFKKLHNLQQNDIQSNFKHVQEQIYEAFTKITPKRYLSNTPYVLKPNTQSWFLCYPSWMTYLNAQSALLAEVCAVPHLLRTKTVLLDAPVYMTELRMVEETVQYVISIAPGDTSHYGVALSAEDVTAKTLLECFGPWDYPAFSKYFLFDKVTCFCDKEDPFTKMLGLTEDTVTFGAVLIQVCKDGQITAMFTAPSGDAWMVSMRRIDGEPMIRNLQKLSTKATESYRNQYEKTKTKLLETATVAYAPLKAKYMQVLGKNDNKVTSDEAAQA